jgi:hypothetical protein
VIGFQQQRLCLNPSEPQSESGGVTIPTAATSAAEVDVEEVFYGPP